MTRISSLYIARSGLRVAQNRLDTATNNVANAGSDGYTRQRVGSSQAPILDLGGGIHVGTGADVGSAMRVRDLGADVRARLLADKSGYDSTQAELINQLERVTAEPDQGVTVAMARLWASFEDLAAAPDDQAVRRDVLGKLGDVAGRINAVADGMRALGGDVTVQLQEGVTAVQSLQEQLVGVNEAIVRGGPTPELEDARDLLSDKLAKLVGGVADVQANGEVRVSVAGRAIVDRNGAAPVAVDGSGTFVELHGTRVPVGGELGGLVEFLSDTYPTYKAEFDAMYAQWADAINAQHMAGQKPDGTGGQPLIGPVDGTNTFIPGSVMVVLTSDPQDLAASGPTGGTYNGENAAAMADLRRTSGVDERVRAWLTDIGASVATAARRSTTSQDLLAAAEEDRDVVHGVSLDEEMVNLVQSQKAYEAAARAMTTLDSVLDTLINRMGV